MEEAGGRAATVEPSSGEEGRGEASAQLDPPFPSPPLPFPRYPAPLSLSLFFLLASLN